MHLTNLTQLLYCRVQSVLHRFFTTEEAEPIIALKRVERAGLKSQQTKSAPHLGGRTVVSSDIGHRNKVVPQDEDEDDGILLDVFASTPASEGYSDSPHSTLLDEPVLRKIQDSLELDDDFLDQTIFATRKQKKGPASISSRRKKKPKARLKYTLDTLLAEPKEQFSGADDFIDELKSPIKEDKREDHNNSMDEVTRKSSYSFTYSWTKDVETGRQVRPRQSSYCGVHKMATGK